MAKTDTKTNPPKNKQQSKAASKNQEQGGGGGGGAAVAEPEVTVIAETEENAEAPEVQVVEKRKNPEPLQGQVGYRKKAGEEDTKYSYAGSAEGCRSTADSRGKVMDYLMAHPGQPFTYKELSHKCDISMHNAWCATRDLEDFEDIKPTKKGTQKAHFYPAEE